MSAHTPGPWEIDEGDGMPIAKVSFRVITAPCISYIGSGLSKDEISANARLIAAAPELLAALYGLGEQVVASHNGWCFDSCADNGIVEGHSPRCAAARAAIAKAEGR